MNPYALFGAVLAAGVLLGGAYLKGRHDESASHLEQIVEDTNEARRFEQARAARIQESNDVKDATIRGINARLADALLRLHNRPERLPEPARAACQGASGAELSGSDAGFLEREAARADSLRAELAACQDREYSATRP
jgi:hypothetical protein